MVAWTVLFWLLLISLLTSWVYYVLCLDSARKWSSRIRAACRSVDTPDYRPPVSILKPLYGTDPEQIENFRSFCGQDYPAYQIVFGALDPDDPAHRRHLG